MSKTKDQIKPNFSPFYAAGMYPELARIFQEHGYALAVHGSMARDFDLIAVPWAERPHKHTTVIRAVKKRFAVEFPVTSQRKRHGRVSYTFNISFGECALDLSFFPGL